MRKHRSKHPVINQPHVLPFDSNCCFLPNRFLNSLSEMGAWTDCWGNWAWGAGKTVKVSGINYLLLYFSLIQITFFLSAFLSLGSSDRKHFCFSTNFRRAWGGTIQCYIVIVAFALQGSQGQRTWSSVLSTRESQSPGAWSLNIVPKLCVLSITQKSQAEANKSVVFPYPGTVIDTVQAPNDQCKNAFISGIIPWCSNDFSIDRKLPVKQTVNRVLSQTWRMTLQWLDA